jgi:hypothetical protein
VPALITNLANETDPGDRFRFTAAQSNGKDLYAFRCAVNDEANTLYLCIGTGHPAFARSGTVTCTGILIEVDMIPRADFPLAVVYDNRIMGLRVCGTRARLVVLPHLRDEPPCQKFINDRTPITHAFFRKVPSGLSTPPPGLTMY